MTCRRPSHRRADVWPEAHGKNFIRISSSIDWKTKCHGLSPENNNNNKRFTASADKKVYERVANAKKEDAAPPTLKLSNWNAASIQTSRICVCGRVESHSGTDTCLLSAWCSQGLMTPAGYPLGVHADSNDDLIVADSLRAAVVRWTGYRYEVIAGGNGVGSSANQLSSPLGIFFQSGNPDMLYVADTANHRIVAWPRGSVTGNVVFGTGTPGDGLSELRYPAGIYLNNSFLYVVDYGNSRVLQVASGTSTGQRVPEDEVLQLPILPTTAADSFFDSFGNFYRVDYGNHRLMFCQRQIMCAFTACKDVDPATAPVLPEPFTQLLMVQAVAAWRTALTAERRCSLLQFLIVRPMFWCCVESSSSPKAVHFEDPGVTEEQTHVVGAEEIPSRHSSQISVNAMPVLSDEENLLIQQSRVSDMSETKEVEVVDIPVHTKESLSTADSAGAESQKDTSCTTMGRRSRLLGRAADSRWKLRRDELEMQKELSRTLKSTLYLATWKGTDVVMKCVEVPANYDRTDDPTRKTSKENFDPTSSRPLHASEVDQDLLEELLHEIELLSSLRHPNLVLFIGACLDKDAPVMCVTEYMPGGDLERHFMTMRKKHQTPTWRPQFRQVMDWSLAVARGLSFLHSREEPIVHRDLKPLNLLLTRHGEVKIADLGISKM
ncbi:unnamed protein product, partial [Symbiodinium necroappetens]